MTTVAVAGGEKPVIRTPIEHLLWDFLELDLHRVTTPGRLSTPLILMEFEEWVPSGEQTEQRNKILDSLLDYIKEAKTEEFF